MLNLRFITLTMPANKSALLRYRIIDACLTNMLRKYPPMGYIIEKIEQQLDTTLSNSMFTSGAAEPGHSEDLFPQP